MVISTSLQQKNKKKMEDITKNLAKLSSDSARDKYVEAHLNKVESEAKERLKTLNNDPKEFIAERRSGAIQDLMDKKVKLEKRVINEYFNHALSDSEKFDFEDNAKTFEAYGLKKQATTLFKKRNSLSIRRRTTIMGLRITNAFRINKKS